MRDNHNQFRNCHYDSRQWSPQAEQQKEAGGGRDHLQHRGWRVSCVRYRRDGTVEKKGSGHKSLEQEPGAGPATSKARK